MTIQEFLQQHSDHRMTLEIQTGKRYGRLTTNTATITNLDLLAAAVTHEFKKWPVTVTGEIQKAYCCGQFAET